MISFWSSIDWQLLQSGEVILADGTKLNLLLMLSVEDQEMLEARYRRIGKSYSRPEIPTFASGPSGFQVVDGEPTPEQLSDLKALHTLHDKEYGTLMAAFQQRQAAQLEALAARENEAAKAPEDLEIRYRVMTPDELEGR